MGIDVGSAFGAIKLDYSSVGKAVAAIKSSLGDLARGSDTAFDKAGQAADDGFGKVTKGADEADKALGRVSSTLGKFINPTTILLGVGAAAAAGFGLAIRSAIDMNATLETTTLQFETLMGDADAAKEHVAGLFEFAKKTPFETGPIIEASKMMRTFGGDVLDTKDNLTLIGDAAAATNAPIDELGFWVGRLYSNLQAGQPFGEAAMRLQELAVMSPQAWQAMMALQESGASASEVFAVFQEDLGRFTGAMERQAGTWPGMISTIKDSLGIALAEGFKPFFDGAKSGAQTIIDVLNSPEFVAGVSQFATRLGEAMAVIVPLALEHGPALIKVLAKLAAGFTGLMVVAKVAGALTTINGLLVTLGVVAPAAAAGTAAAGAAAAGAAGGAGLLSGALALLTGPIGLIIAAVGLLAVAWAKDWGGIREKTAAAIDWIREKIDVGLGGLRAFWEEHGAGIVLAAQRIWQAITGHFEVFLDNIRDWGKIVQAIFQGDWEQVGKLLHDIVSRSIQAVVDLFMGIDEALRPAFDALEQKINEWWFSIDWENLGENAAKGLASGLQGLDAYLTDLDLRLKQGIKDIAKGWAAGGQAGTTDSWVERAAAEAAAAIAQASQEAASADRVLQQHAQNYEYVAAAIESATDATLVNLSGGRALSAHLETSGERLKLAADRSNHFAGGLSGLTARAAEAAAGISAAQAAVEAYNAAFASVQGDYTNELPGADKPLVTPETTVSIVTGGPTAEQSQLLETYRGEVEKLQEELSDLTNGVGTFGVEQEKVNEKIAAAQGEIAHYQSLMGPLEGITGQVSTSQRGLAVNVSAVHQAIYDQLLAVGAAPEVVTAFAAATGIMSQAQMEAALQAAAVKVKIDELAIRMAEGLPIEAALADLDAFINKIEAGVEPATETMATDVPQRVTDMKDAMSEEALAAGEAVPSQVAAGVTAGLDTVTGATENIANEAIAAAEAIWGDTTGGLAYNSGAAAVDSIAAGAARAEGDLADTMGGAAGAGMDEVDRVADSEGPVVGAAMIDGVVAGVRANRAELIEEMKVIARDAYAAAMTELEAHSPSRLFMNVGTAIIDGIIAGLAEEEDVLNERMEEIGNRLYNHLADTADRLHGIWSGVFGIQNDQLQAQIDAADEAMSAAGEVLGTELTGPGGLAGFLSEGQLYNLNNLAPEDVLEFLLNLRRKGPFANNPEAQRRLEESIQAAVLYNQQLEERNALEEEHKRQQEELKALEEARQQLDFLGYQMDLLNLIAENGLDSSILDGLNLGLDANMSDIIAAMTAAVQELIAATEDELEIASPSGVFRDIGENIMAGLAAGIEDNQLRLRPLLDDSELADPLAALRRELEGVVTDSDAAAEAIQKLGTATDESLALTNPAAALQNTLTGMAEGMKKGIAGSSLVDAMTAAIQELIAETEQELGIASSSKVFRGIGSDIMTGLAMGIADHRSLNTVLRERLLDAQQLGLNLSPEQTIYIFGGYNPTVSRGTASADPLRDLYYQGL